MPPPGRRAAGQHEGVARSTTIPGRDGPWRSLLERCDERPSIATVLGYAPSRGAHGHHAQAVPEGFDDWRAHHLRPRLRSDGGFRAGARAQDRAYVGDAVDLPVLLGE